jgi:hypothetical protein
MYTIYPNLCKDYVDVARGGISPYGSDTRHHIRLPSCDKRRHEDTCHYLSLKIIYDIQGCVVKLWKLNHFKYA